MAKCVRQGVVYKRHQFKDGRCKKCGASQLVASMERAKHRQDHRMALKHKPNTGRPGGNSHDRAVAAELQAE